MNIYLTTMAIAAPAKSIPRMVLDACIDSLLMHYNEDSLQLKGIIVPDWTNPDKAKIYRGVPVQSIVSRSGNPSADLRPRDKALLEYETTNVNKRTHEKKHWAKNKKEAQNDSDNEHQALFEQMQCKYPCLISDGDIIYDNADFSALKVQLKNHNKSVIILPRSHLVYLHQADDRLSILLNAKNQWGGIYYKTMHCRKGLVNAVVNKTRASMQTKA